MKNIFKYLTSFIVLGLLFTACSPENFDGANANGITFQYTDPESYVSMEGISLNGDYPNNSSGHGIYLPDDTTNPYGRGINLTNVYITKFAGKGLYIGRNRGNGHCYNLAISRCEDAVYLYKSSDWKFIQGEFGVVRQFCVNIPNGGADNQFIGCSMWQSQEAAVNIYTLNSSPQSFLNCTFDHHQKNAVRISGSTGLIQPHTFIGCWFRENSQALNNGYANVLLTSTKGTIFVGNRFTDQEGSPVPSYMVEFAGSGGAKPIVWVGNEYDSAATAVSNTPSNLQTSAERLLCYQEAFLGGEGDAYSLLVAKGAAGGNYVQILGRSSGNPAEISAQGADTNVNLRLISKGTGSVDLYPGNLRALRAIGTTSAVNYAEIYNSVSGSPVEIRSGGSDTDIDLKLVGKGNGVVQFGGYSGSGGSIVGHITIKDETGVTRKLAVIS